MPCLAATAKSCCPVWLPLFTLLTAVSHAAAGPPHQPWQWTIPTPLSPHRHFSLRCLRLNDCSPPHCRDPISSFHPPPHFSERIWLLCCLMKPKCFTLWSRPQWTVVFNPPMLQLKILFHPPRIADCLHSGHNQHTKFSSFPVTQFVCTALLHPNEMETYTSHTQYKMVIWVITFLIVWSHYLYILPIIIPLIAIIIILVACRPTYFVRQIIMVNALLESGCHFSVMKAQILAQSA